MDSTEYLSKRASGVKALLSGAKGLAGAGVHTADAGVKSVGAKLTELLLKNKALATADKKLRGGYIADNIADYALGRPALGQRFVNKYEKGIKTPAGPSKAPATRAKLKEDAAFRRSVKGVEKEVGKGYDAFRNRVVGGTALGAGALAAGGATAAGISALSSDDHNQLKAILGEDGYNKLIENGPAIGIGVGAAAAAGAGAAALSSDSKKEKKEKK
jgi:hypothetical protein